MSEDEQCIARDDVMSALLDGLGACAEEPPAVAGGIAMAIRDIARKLSKGVIIEGYLDGRYIDVDRKAVRIIAKARHDIQCAEIAGAGLSCCDVE